MGFLNLTALPGPLSARVLPFVVQLSWSPTLLGSVAAAVVGMLSGALLAWQRRRARAHAAPLRLVVPARSAR